MEELTKEVIMTMLQKASEKGSELGMPSTIAIVDVGGNLVGFLRPEGGRISNVSLAINKAWTAIAMKRPSSQVQPLIQPGAMGYGIHISEPRICAVGGALPITKDGVNYLGGIGVSGGPPETDEIMCEVALEAAGFQTKFGEFKFKQK